MTTDTKTSGYSHTQKAPLCLLIYALAVVFLALGFFVQDAPPIQWLFPPIGLLMFVLAASFHHLSVVDEGDVLAIRFGPVPLFRKTVRYAETAFPRTQFPLKIDNQRNPFTSSTQPTLAIGLPRCPIKCCFDHDLPVWSFFLGFATTSETIHRACGGRKWQAFDPAKRS